MHNNSFQKRGQVDFLSETAPYTVQAKTWCFTDIGPHAARAKNPTQPISEPDPVSLAVQNELRIHKLLFTEHKNSVN
jgi:hypothetical protein